MSLQCNELSAQLKARGPALKKDWLLKKQVAGGGRGVAGRQAWSSSGTSRRGVSPWGSVAAWPWVGV